MNCAISGVLPTEPMVTKDGILYEKRLILKMITENKSCPVTGNELSEKDLIPITSCKILIDLVAGFSKPKAPSEASVPNILLSLQNEWDSVMLETFELKKQYQELQTQLSNCLYENDAAKRVIARLLKERDEARKSLVEFKASYKPSAPAHEAKAMEEDEPPLPAEIQDKMDQVYKK
jgi:pre-mRNA-processing factor 19